MADNLTDDQLDAAINNLPMTHRVVLEPHPALLPKIGMPEPTPDGAVPPPAPAPIAPTAYNTPATNPTPSPQGSQPEFINPHKAEVNRLEATGSGVSQVHNPFLRTLGRIGDVALSTLAPRIAMLTPGTTAHHNALIAQQEGGLNQDIKQGQEEATTAAQQAEIPLREAETTEAKAKAEAALNPKPEKEANPEQQAFNEYLKTMTPQDAFRKVQQDKTEGANLGKPEPPEKDDQRYEKIIADEQLKKQISPEDTAFKTAYEKRKNLGAQFKIDNRAPAAEPGSWQLAEVNGKTVLYNSKTSEVKDAPEGLAKTGTYAKTTGGANDARQYAQDYLASGNYTGPGDEALQEKFFELAKPSSGFRMTQPQIQQLQSSRNWMNGFEGRAYHALHGTWFSDDQRKQIVDTMNQLADAKAKGNPNATPPKAAPKTNAKDPLGIL